MSYASKTMGVLIAVTLAIGLSFFPEDRARADGLNDNAMNPPANWRGLYIGGHAGGAVWGVTTLVPAFDIDTDGFLGGGHVGYNLQIGDGVIGVEGDFDFADVDGSTACPNPAFTCSAETDWIASLRGRFGLSVGSFLLYSTGGFAFADIESQATPAVGGFTVDKTHVGFVVGGGAEWMFRPGWIARVEGLFYDFGGESVAAGPTVTQDLFVARGGISFQLGHWLDGGN